MNKNDPPNWLVMDSRAINDPDDASSTGWPSHADEANRLHKAILALIGQEGA